MNLLLLLFIINVHTNPFPKSFQSPPTGQLLYCDHYPFSIYHKEGTSKDANQIIFKHTVASCFILSGIKIQTTNSWLIKPLKNPFLSLTSSYRTFSSFLHSCTSHLIVFLTLFLILCILLFIPSPFIPSTASSTSTYLPAPPRLRSPLLSRSMSSLLQPQLSACSLLMSLSLFFKLFFYLREILSGFTNILFSESNHVKFHF